MQIHVDIFLANNIICCLLKCVLYNMDNAVKVMMLSISICILYMTYIIKCIVAIQFNNRYNIFLFHIYVFILGLAVNTVKCQSKTDKARADQTLSKRTAFILYFSKTVYGHIVELAVIFKDEFINNLKTILINAIATI